LWFGVPSALAGGGVRPDPSMTCRAAVCQRVDSGLRRRDASRSSGTCATRTAAPSTAALLRTLHARRQEPHAEARRAAVAGSAPHGRLPSRGPPVRLPARLARRCHARLWAPALDPSPPPRVWLAVRRPANHHRSTSACHPSASASLRAPPASCTWERPHGAYNYLHARVTGARSCCASRTRTPSVPRRTLCRRSSEACAGWGWRGTRDPARGVSTALLPEPARAFYDGVRAPARVRRSRLPVLLHARRTRRAPQRAARACEDPR